MVQKGTRYTLTLPPLLEQDLDKWYRELVLMSQYDQY